ncbi:MAG: transporter substrate-binding domain-containing protein [Alphaproteobacteria bacterium]|nr:transporter substrate-binding domain-containing protein [Alphaproteobacteria bacterium]
MRRIKSVLIATAVAVGLSFSVGANAADKLKIGTEGAYPPFNFIDESGELKGFDVEIAGALCAAMKVECEFIEQDWDGIIPALLAKKFDAIVASMSVTEERKQSVAFTDRYYSNLIRFVGPKGQTIDTSLEGLKGKSIGAQRATVAGSYLEDKLGSDASIKLYDTQENANLDLVSGRLDLLFADGLVMYEWLKSKDGEAFQFYGEGLSLDEGIAIALRKEDEELRGKINEAIKAIRADGTYEKINAKYFPFSIY